MISFKNYSKHSPEFKLILKEEMSNRYKAIRTITHSTPVLVFWVTPDGNVLDAKNAHRDNPPNGDKTVFSDKTHKGHLRGRISYIGTILYCVIYGEDGYELTRRQLSLLKRSLPRIMSFLTTKNVPQNDIDEMILINEIGDNILL